MEKLPLAEAFEKVRDALPHIVGGKRPIGHGHFGIAIGDDASVYKILYRPENEEERAKSLRQFIREADILAQFAGQDLRGIEVPQLITPPELLDHDRFMAVYSMTRIDGRTNPMMPEDDYAASIYAEKYRNTGALIARFHDAVGSMDLGEAIPVGPLKGTSILTSSHFDDQTNEKLAIADKFLQAHMKPGNIHGDSNMRNVMERDSKPVGLIDFGSAGRVDNMMMELWTMPHQYINDVIKGYEEESGEEIGMTVHATNLSMWSHLIRHPDNSAEARAMMQGKVRGLLRTMMPVLER